MQLKHIFDTIITQKHARSIIAKTLRLILLFLELLLILRKWSFLCLHCFTLLHDGSSNNI